MVALSQKTGSRPDIVGLIPAGGKAKRIAPLPCSKELYPVGFHNAKGDLGLRPKVISHYLLEKMRLAGIIKVYIILRKGKWDIPGYFGDGKILDMHLAYLMMDLPFGVPYTLDQAFPFVQDKMVALGFPDVLLQPQNSFMRLLEKQAKIDSDVILGLYPTDHPHKMDVVDVKKDGRITSISVKPPKSSKTKLMYTWQTAVWKPVFTEYLHAFVARHNKRFSANSAIKMTGDEQELFLGDIFQAAIKDEFNINSVVFSKGSCLDIGTPEDLARAMVKTDIRIAGKSQEKLESWNRKEI
jgi:glucose-1-phosphate thymidylyltransferase